jgi:hypothetical protein
MIKGSLQHAIFTGEIRPDQTWMRSGLMKFPAFRVRMRKLEQERQAQEGFRRASDEADRFERARPKRKHDDWRHG